jgi:hypothetical protein
MKRLFSAFLVLAMLLLDPSTASAGPKSNTTINEIKKRNGGPLRKR